MTKTADAQKDDKAKIAPEEKAKLRPQPRYKAPVEDKDDDDLFNDMPV